MIDIIIGIIGYSMLLYGIATVLGIIIGMVITR